MGEVGWETGDSGQTGEGIGEGIGGGGGAYMYVGCWTVFHVLCNQRFVQHTMGTTTAHVFPHSQRKHRS